MTKRPLQWNAESIVLGKKKNWLLLKDDVGAAKPSVRHLPSEDFFYGKPELFASRETAQDSKCKSLHHYAVTTSWQFPQHSSLKG